MASANAQKKWRDKHRFVKKQLNVMTRRLIHSYLDEIAEGYGLRGKGEAVAFSCFVTKALIQRAGFNAEAARILEVFHHTYNEDRDIYSS